MQRLGYCYGAADVGVMEALLAAHGFVGRFEDRAMCLTVTPWATAVGGVAFHVLDKDAQDAAALLADLPPMVSTRRSVAALAVFVIACFFVGAPPSANGVYQRRLPGSEAGQALR